VVAPGAIYSTDNPTQVLVVPKNSPLRNAADLNGKTIGTTSLGDILAQSTLAWIDEHDGNAASVHVVEIPPTAIEGALHTARIDAATLTEPHLSQAVGDGSVAIFAKIFDAIAPRFAESAYFAMPAYIEAHRDVTVRFAKAILGGNVFANDHPDRTAPWLVESAKVDLASVQHARRKQFAATIDPVQIQVVIDALVRMKAIDRGFAATDMVSPLVIGLRPG
jgi:NitT/TauT family transport system substrate-binding protein